MANEIEIKVPDIGGATQVDVIEILVQVGQEISIDTPLITLESDKASMEIPAPKAGVITSIAVKIGDKVAEGDLILKIKYETQSQSKPIDTLKENKNSVVTTDLDANKISKENLINNKLATVEVFIPDIGGATAVEVIEVFIKVGMNINKDEALVTLEGEKATMDIPSPYTGIVKEVSIKLGDKVAQGYSIGVLEILDESSQAKAENNKELSRPKVIESTDLNAKSAQEKKVEVLTEKTENNKNSIAGPAVRRMARELGVNLALVQGTGRKTRIVKEDVQAFVKEQLTTKNSTNAFAISANPTIDFSQFGTVESKPLNKIKKITGINVHRAWITIPHVTQFDAADITQLEAFRKSEVEAAKNSTYKLTLLAFVCAVVSKALHVFPQFNASLDPSGENLLFKKYYNIGIAVETPHGLVVPVIKQVDTLSVSEIAQEMTRLSTKARDKSLLPADMAGGCFTISSLGGIGGSAFTPIVNSPEVAILGLSRAAIKPIFNGQEFIPRLMLPLSLSYDHRVIDGAEAARFTHYLSETLSDIRKILL